MAASLDSIKESPEKARKSGLKADNMCVPAGRNNNQKQTGQHPVERNPQQPGIVGYANNCTGAGFLIHKECASKMIIYSCLLRWTTPRVWLCLDTQKNGHLLKLQNLQTEVHSANILYIWLNFVNFNIWNTAQQVIRHLKSVKS